FHSGFEQYLREGGAGENKIARRKTFSSSSKCPGCRWSPKTGKTRDLNKHMDLTRFRPCRALLQLTQAQNISQTGNTIQAPAPVDNLALASEGDLISFDKNLPTHQPAQPSVPAVNLLTGDIPEADPEAGP
ncbi:18290_t:CDS:2, partial [Gigaspora rosea]